MTISIKTREQLQADLATQRSPSCPDRHNYCPEHSDGKENELCAFLSDPSENRAARRARCLQKKADVLDSTRMAIDFGQSGKADLTRNLVTDLSKKEPSISRKALKLFKTEKL